jgi:hypothetical protein
MVNRVQIEHGAKEASLAGDCLQPRARVTGGLPNAYEKAPVNKDLPRSAIAGIPESNIKRLVRGGKHGRDDRRNPAPSGSDRPRAKIVSRCMVAFRVRELRVRIDGSRHGDQTRRIELLELLIQLLVELCRNVKVNTARNDLTVTNQEISHRGLWFIAEQDGTDNDCGHDETVPCSGQVRGDQPVQSDQQGGS